MYLYIFILILCNTITCSLNWNSIGDAGLKVLIDALLVNCKHVKDIE